MEIVVAVIVAIVIVLAIAGAQPGHAPRPTTPAGTRRRRCHYFLDRGDEDPDAASAWDDDVEDFYDGMYA